jgi:hypothetical protein
VTHQIFAQNRAIAFILVFLLVIQVVVGGMYISVVMGPPCVAVVTPFGWVVAFWVRKKSFSDYFYLKFL